MKQIIICVLTICIWNVEKMHAQDTLRTTKTKPVGEIVMTQAELDSFLNNIANLKRQQIEKRKNEISLNRKANEVLDATPQANVTSPATTQSYAQMDYINSTLLLREFDRINSRIDLLMLNSGNMAQLGYMQQQSAPMSAPTTYAAPQPMTYSYQNTPAPETRMAPVVANVAVPETAKQVDSSNAEVDNLKKQIGVLNEELRVLNALSKNGNDTAYKAELATINARIATLDQNLSQQETAQKATTKSNEEAVKNLKTTLSAFNQKVYFANNSSTVSAQYLPELKEIAGIATQNAANVHVVLRGFASKSGSAIYNNEISFKRAEAVKKILLGYGVDAKNITILHHGTDNSQDQSLARRVEITFSVH